MLIFFYSFSHLCGLLLSYIIKPPAKFCDRWSLYHLDLLLKYVSYLCCACFSGKRFSGKRLREAFAVSITGLALYPLLIIYSTY